MINQVKVVEQKGYLVLQLPSCFSKEFYGKKQKYIAFGAKDSNENRSLAYDAATRLQKDLEEGTFHPDNEVAYKHPSRQRKIGYELKNKSLLELYDLWIERTKKEGKKSGNRQLSKTGELKYRGEFRRVMEALPQTFLTKDCQEQVAEYLEENYGAGTQSNILNQLYNMLEWAKDKNLLPNNTPNYFKEFKKNAGNPKKQGCPELLKGLETFRDPEKKAWTKEERDLIISAIHQRRKHSPYYKECDVLGLLIEFLFHTGMRHGEAFALRWNRVHITEGGVQVAITQSYSSQYKITKGTKTEKPRTIWIDQRAQEIIKTLRDFYESKNRECKGSNLVFQKELGKGFNSHDLTNIWYGDKKTGRLGIVSNLVKEGKLPQYLKIYSTRHTFASLQAQNNQDPKTVADYIGDTVEMVLEKYYQSRRVEGAVPALDI
jgi:integrase